VTKKSSGYDHCISLPVSQPCSLGRRTAWNTNLSILQSMDSHNAIFKLGTNLSSELVPDGAHITLRSSTRQTKLQGTNVLDFWNNTGATTMFARDLSFQGTQDQYVTKQTVQRLCFQGRFKESTVCPV